MNNTQTNTHTSTGLYFMSLRKLVLFFFSQIRFAIVHTANYTAIISAMLNIAHDCTKQKVMTSSDYSTH